MANDKAGLDPSHPLLQQLKDVHAVQGTDGNWNSDRYMRGMFNGMELALAIMEGREVSYKEPPGDYLHEPNPQDFAKSLEHLLNYAGWDSAVGMPDSVLADMLVHILQGMEVAHDKQLSLQSKQNTDPQAPAISPAVNYQSTELGPGNTV